LRDFGGVPQLFTRSQRQIVPDRPLPPKSDIDHLEQVSAAIANLGS
jgi:hypothetical protein